MLLSTRAIDDARRVDDTFILVAMVAGTFFANGLENFGVAMKASSNSLRQSFSMVFSASIPLMESSRASPITR
jgi:hypothetical protein